MTEHQMEDLIAQFPEEFFSNNPLTLKGRQKSFAEVGRFDLLFQDSHHTSVLMELKAVPAKYDHASQLAKYKDELERRGEKNILMWLVAPYIPSSVREFLDRIGIEYTEIHPVQFQRVAERHGVKIETEVSESVIPNGVNHRAHSSVAQRISWANSPYQLKQDFEPKQLDQLLKTFESVVKRDIDRSVSHKLRQELLDSNPPDISRATTGQLAKWCNTNNPLYWDGMEVARKISQLLFDCLLDRNKLGV
jgi:hypothetical protein